MCRLPLTQCIILSTSLLVGVALPAVAVEERQVTPEIVWTYHRPMSEQVLRETPSSGIASVRELSDGTIVAYLLESHLDIPLLFRFSRTGQPLWGVRLGEQADELGNLSEQIQPVPGLPPGGPEAGIMVLDTFNVWRVGPSGELPWKRSGDRFGLNVITSMAVLDDQSVVVGGMTPGKPCHAAEPALAMLDRYGDRLWLRSFRVSQRWDFVVQTVPLADGRILGLVDPEGPAMFMGSASNSCRDRSGEQHLVWLDREGNPLGMRDLPRESTIERLVEQPGGQLVAVVSHWHENRWSLRTMDAEGTTIREHSYGPADFSNWDDELTGVIDLRVAPDGLHLAGWFNCSGKDYCLEHSINRFFKLAPNGEVLSAVNTGPRHVFAGFFAPDLRSFVARSSNSEIVRVPLD